MDKMKRAALYTRFSTDQQSSTADQVRVCEQLAERGGFVVTHRFADEAISGGTANRPNYQRMLSAARRGDFDVIVAEDSSRLWRNMAEQSPRLAELADLSIDVVTHDLDTRQESGAMVGAVKGAMSEDYRKEIARRVNRTHEGKAKAKQFTGGKPYGYRVNDPHHNNLGKSVIQIDPEQAKQVRWIFKCYAEGQSAMTIAHELNRLEVPSPGSTWNRKMRRSHSWMASAISGDPARGIGILNNEKYIGRFSWRRTTGKRSRQDSSNVVISMTPEAGVYRWTDEDLRIVPQELWDRVKARQRYQSATRGAPVRAALKARAAGVSVPARGKPKHLCSGLLRCDVCDANFVMTSGLAYSCSTYRYGGPSACNNSVLVPRIAAERAMLAAPEQQLLPHVEAVKREAMRLWTEQTSGTGAAEVQRLREALSKVGGEIDNLVAALATGALGASSAIAQALPAREAEKARLEQQLAVAQAMRGKVTQMIPNLEGRVRTAIRDVQKLAQGRDAKGIARAREMLRQLYGGPVRVRAEERNGKRVPVAVTSVPAFALLAVAGEGRTDCSGSGGRI